MLQLLRLLQSIQPADAWWRICLVPPDCWRGPQALVGCICAAFHEVGDVVVSEDQERSLIHDPVPVHLKGHWSVRCYVTSLYIQSTYRRIEDIACCSVKAVDPNAVGTVKLPAEGQAGSHRALPHCALC